MKGQIPDMAPYREIYALYREQTVDSPLFFFPF